MPSSFSNTDAPAADAFEARASPGGYVMLTGVWVLLGLLWTWLAMSHSSNDFWAVAALCFGVALLWVLWLRGFRVRISHGQLEYRNGLYQTQRCLLADIAKSNARWVTERLLGRRLSHLRLVVAVRQGGPIHIHMKPFSRANLTRMRELLCAATDTARVCEAPAQDADGKTEA